MTKTEYPFGSKLSETQIRRLARLHGFADRLGYFVRQVKKRGDPSLTRVDVYREAWDLAVEDQQRKRAREKVKERGGGVRRSTRKEISYKLVERGKFQGIQTTSLAAIEWVADHLVVEGVSPGECPNARTWGLLLWARKDVDRFWTTVYPKLLPSKSVMDRESAAMLDDGRDVQATLTEVSMSAGVPVAEKVVEVLEVKEATKPAVKVEVDSGMGAWV